MHTNRRSLAWVLLLSALLLPLAACGGDDDGGGAATTTTTEAPSSTTTEAPVEETAVRAYFLRDEVVGPVAREVAGTAAAAGAMEGLLAGPTDTEQQLGFSTAVPAGTELLGVVIDDGVATVDLSGAFASGGGSASMLGRVAQVVFTLTQFPSVDAVAFELDGEPVTALGGEGVLLEEPQTRAGWEAQAPAILVESPLPFAEVASPLRIAGTANTFEAAFRVNVVDGEGLIVYDERAMATSGTGTRGTFDVTATFEVPRAGVGAVIVWEESAKDGSQINLVEVPIRL